MLDSDLTEVIGFCGFKGSGKDTAADYLCEHHGYEKISLAYPLKTACQKIFGFSDQAVFGASQYREEPDSRYTFSGKDPVDGSQLTKVARDVRHYWQRESDGEWFPQYITPRLALQTLGTEWGRRLYEDIWVDACMNFIRSSSHSRWVISDVRFMNELAGVQRAGGRVIRLMRGQRESNHPSELELESIDLSEFDHVIMNLGTKKDLYAMLDSVMKGAGQPSA